MSFCPACGTPFEPGQNFCKKCGYDIAHRVQAPQGEALPTMGPKFPSKIYAMNADSLYIFGDDGITKYSTGFPLIAIPIVLGAILGIATVAILDEGSWVALTVAFIMVLAPIVGEYRYRRLRGRLEASAIIPWSSVQHMWIQGHTLTMRLPGGWTTTTLDDEDVVPMSIASSAMLGPSFSSVTIPTHARFSPLAKFSLLTIGLFILTQVILLAASFAPFFAGEQARYAAIYGTIEQGVTGVTIFQEWVEILTNNLQVALAAFVPGFGEFTLAASSYNTGRIIQVAAAHFNISPGGFIFALYILPHSWVEELSYPLASALGLYGLAEWRRQSYKQFSNWRTRASTKFSVGVGLVALILAVAAFFEVTEPRLGIAALLFWVPVVLGVSYWYVRLRSRLARALA